MPEKTVQILPLPAEVAAQIESSTAIPSLSTVVLGLIENSLDAGAKKIDVSVNLARGGCTVEDNGDGIEPNEFAADRGLGKPYHTSKYSSPEIIYGRNGTFLTSLAALSILTITSKHRVHLSHSTLILHHSRSAARLLQAPSHHLLLNRDHGTRVSVQDLFGNMPVRVKQRKMGRADAEKSGEKELEAIKRQIVALLLAWNVPVSISLTSADGTSKKLNIRNKEGPGASADNTRLTDRERKGCQKLLTKVSSEVSDSRPFDLPLICSMLSQSTYVEPSDWNTWVKTSARSSTIAVEGAISLRPAPSKHVQFIALGIRPINAETGSNLLYEEINRLFASSSFGNDENVSDDDGTKRAKRSKDRRYKKDAPTNKQLRGGGKGVDRWPMFFIRIELQEGDDPKRLEREGVLSNILRILGAMVQGFLKDNYFRPRARLRNHGQDAVKKSAVAGLSPPSSALEKGAKLPSLRRERDHFHMLSTWSRIKSGTGSIPEDVLGDKAQVVQPVMAQLPKMNKNDEVVTIVNNGEEQTVEWTNPVSKVTVLVDSRTGFVVPKPNAVQRTVTAPSNARLFTSSIKPRFTRSVSTPFVTPKEGSWASIFLSEWENPIFATPEVAIPQVSLNGPTLETSNIVHGHHHHYTAADIQKAFIQSSHTFSTKLSKAALRNLRVIGQVDKKFILVSMSGSEDSELLILVDQHAADERIRVEQLLSDLHTQPPTLLPDPLTLELDNRELALFTQHTGYFTDWGINYALTPPSHSSQSLTKPKVIITHLPPVIAERARLGPKILLSLLRTEVWNLSSALTHNTNTKTPPQGLLDMINSRACRSAIMFNDVLTKEECVELMRRLGGCGNPFVCAHGRPSMVPLVDLGGKVKSGAQESGFGAWGGRVENEGVDEEFGRMWRRWRGAEGRGEHVK